MSIEESLAKLNKYLETSNMFGQLAELVPGYKNQESELSNSKLDSKLSGGNNNFLSHFKSEESTYKTAIANGQTDRGAMSEWLSKPYDFNAGKEPELIHSFHPNIESNFADIFSTRTKQTPEFAEYSEKLQKFKDKANEIGNRIRETLSSKVSNSSRLDIYLTETWYKNRSIKFLNSMSKNTNPYTEKDLELTKLEDMPCPTYDKMLAKFPDAASIKANQALCGVIGCTGSELSDEEIYGKFLSKLEEDRKQEQLMTHNLHKLKVERARREHDQYLLGTEAKKIVLEGIEELKLYQVPEELYNKVKELDEKLQTDTTIETYGYLVLGTYIMAEHMETSEQIINLLHNVAYLYENANRSGIIKFIFSTLVKLYTGLDIKMDAKAELKRENYLPPDFKLNKYSGPVDLIFDLSELLPGELNSYKKDTKLFKELSEDILLARLEKKLSNQFIQKFMTRIGQVDYIMGDEEVYGDDRDKKRE